ncbi:Putative membrane protein [Vibrio vulnificus]
MRGNDSWWRGGGVLSFLFFAAELSSAFSFLVFVILANAGTHRIASAVARFSRFIVVVGFAFVVVCCGEYISKRGFWHVWMNGSPVCTGMTVGGVAAVC